VPRLLAALEAVGLARGASTSSSPTHVHLDHAGGAGLLMQHLPGRALVVHPRGAPHLIDPSAADGGALAVYGDAEVDALLRRVVGDRRRAGAGHARRHALDFAGAPLRFLDTPGHARHHHCSLGRAQPQRSSPATPSAVVPRVRHRARRLAAADHHAGAVRARALRGSVERMLACDRA
jgi:hypothetical protein